MKTWLKGFKESSFMGKNVKKVPKVYNTGRPKKTGISGFVYKGSELKQEM